MRAARIAGGLAGLAAAALLYAPLLALLARSADLGAPGGPSGRWYAAALADPGLRGAAGTSLLVAALAAVLATLIGTLGALALTLRPAPRGRGLLGALLLAPLALPDALLGLAFLLLAVALGLERGPGTLALAHAALGVPFVAVTVRAGLLGLDPALAEAARDLGASPARAFARVVLPAIRPAVLGGGALAFAVSLDDLVVGSFVAGPGATTLPMRVFGAVRLGVTPAIDAACVLLALAALGAAGMGALAGRVGRR